MNNDNNVLHISGRYRREEPSEKVTAKGLTRRPNPDLEAIRGITAGQLLARNLPPRRQVIEPWLRDGETAMIWAASGVGKTMLCLSLALAVAGGGRVAEWSAPEPGPVLYVDGEMNVQDLQDRIAHLLDTGAVELTEEGRKAALGNLLIEARQDQEPGSIFYDLTQEETRQTIRQKAQRMGAQLVILDNMTTLTDGLEDENDATKFKSLQGFFMEMKQAGVALILVHHANKGGKQLRGSTALEATFEVVLGLTKPTIAPIGTAAFVTRFDKFRGKGDQRTQPLSWRLANEGWEVEQAEPEDLSEDPVIVALRSLNFTTQKELAEAVGIDQANVSRRIKKAKELGVLKIGEDKDRFAAAKRMRIEGFNDLDSEEEGDIEW